MAMMTAQRKTVNQPTLVYGPESNGMLMTPREFDRGEFDPLYRYELINGVLIVSPMPSLNEVDPNEELGYMLREYRDTHPQGKALDATVFERYVRVGRNRRRADRVIWAGLGRKPRETRDLPTIAVEFVSKRKRDRIRDYLDKKREYLKAGVKEYWVFDRFRHTLTVFIRIQGKTRQKVFTENQIYQTDLLPGFELPIKRLFALADSWPDDPEELPSILGNES